MSPLLGPSGYDVGAAAFAAHKHRITRTVDLALAADASSTFVRPTRGIDRPYVFQGAGHVAIEVGIERV